MIDGARNAWIAFFFSGIKLTFVMTTMDLDKLFVWSMLLLMYLYHPLTGFVLELLFSYEWFYER